MQGYPGSKYYRLSKVENSAKIKICIIKMSSPNKYHGQVWQNLHFQSDKMATHNQGADQLDKDYSY